MEIYTIWNLHTYDVHTHLYIQHLNYVVSRPLTYSRRTSQSSYMEICLWQWCVAIAAPLCGVWQITKYFKMEKKKAPSQKSSNVQVWWSQWVRLVRRCWEQRRCAVTPCHWCREEHSDGPRRRSQVTTTHTSWSRYVEDLCTQDKTKQSVADMKACSHIPLSNLSICAPNLHTLCKLDVHKAQRK